MNRLHVRFRMFLFARFSYDVWHGPQNSRGDYSEKHRTRRFNVVLNAGFAPAEGTDSFSLTRVHYVPFEHSLPLREVRVAIAAFNPGRVGVGFRSGRIGDFGRLV